APSPDWESSPSAWGPGWRQRPEAGCSAARSPEPGPSPDDEKWHLDPYRPRKPAGHRIRRSIERPLFVVLDRPFLGEILRLAIYSGHGQTDPLGAGILRTLGTSGWAAARIWPDQRGRRTVRPSSVAARGHAV